MKKYLLSVCYPAGGTQPAPDDLQRIMRDVTAIQKEMQDKGVWVFAGGLTDHGTATVLRAQGGEIVMTDGPFVESKEQIGGLTIVKASDLDEALGWAGRLTRAIGVPIEVRAFQDGHG